MLDALTDLLRTENLVGVNEQLTFDINLVAAHELYLQAFAPTGAFFHARVKNRRVGSGEYHSCLKAWDLFPEFAPEPLSHHVNRDWEVVVLRGIAHKVVPRGRMAKQNSELSKQILRFFAASRRSGRACTAD